MADGSQPRLDALLRQGQPIDGHRPWPRSLVDARLWERIARALAAGHLTLLGLWGEPGGPSVALLDERDGAIGIASLGCPDRRFPSLAAHHPPALRLERSLADLFGLKPLGSADPRPWLDHGRWGLAAPLGEVEGSEASGTPYSFLPVEGEGLHRIPVGPVHAGIIEPGHFRFTANGETVVRLEARLGYTHKGIEGLMAGADLGTAARLAGRTSGDSSLAYALAFARAVEAALGIEVPPRAHWLRALMAELERLANHLGDIGAICNDAAFALMLAHCSVLREEVLRAAEACFGSRLLRDLVLPGGVACDLEPGGATHLAGLLGAIRRRFPKLVALYDNTASLLDRTVATGILKPELARQYGAGGFVGRASGRDFDARRAPGYPPYDSLEFQVPLREEGDVNARIWIRIEEVEQSLALIQQILERLPRGALRVEPPSSGGEGMALVEGFRGDILVWVRLGPEGRIERCHLRDPSWFQWPLLEAAIEGNIVADFPLCNKSFNCSYSGQDL